MPTTKPSRPKSIRLGGRRWAIKFQPPAKMPDCYGLCTFATTNIDIAEGQLPFDEADTILHEVFHAILFSQGRVPGGDMEEIFVRALATGLIGALSDNPAFAQWLLNQPHTK